MFVMSVYALISATIVVTSTSKERILMDVYVGFELSVAPVYQSEIVPAPVRGMVVGTYQLAIGLGGLVINSICRATSSFQDNRAYRIPFGLFYVIPTILICLIWFISRVFANLDGRPERRTTSSREGTMPDADMDHEFAKIQQSLLEEPEQGRTKELFQGATGQAFASQYGTVWVKSLGTLNPFDVTLGSSALSSGMSILCLFLADRVGRREILLLGSAVQAVALYTIAGLGVPNPVPRANRSGMVGMLLLFGAGFGLGWGHHDIRGGYRSAGSPTARPLLAGFVPRQHLHELPRHLQSFTLPYLLNAPYAALQGKVDFIFGSIAVCSALFVFFCVPECKGRSLEEVDRMFHEGVLVRHFGDHPADETRVNADKVTDEEDGTEQHLAKEF
ncbi:High-affinity glucose transporter RGT2, partial [Colletotrichum shisoi]